jgi:hypothetical protein
VHQWVDQVLAPAVTRQGRAGWNILQALVDVKAAAQASGDAHSAAAAAAVDARVHKVGAGAGAGPALACLLAAARW